jgi:hypothetical protein
MKKNPDPELLLMINYTVLTEQSGSFPEVEFTLEGAGGHGPALQNFLRYRGLGLHQILFSLLHHKGNNY